MTEISKTSSGFKDLVCPDTESTEVDINQDGVTVVKSLCYFCHANCGVLAYVKDGDVIKIKGDPDYSSQGGLCCRGTSALLHVNHPARINHALKRVGEKGEGKWGRSRTIRLSRRSPIDSTRSRPKAAPRPSRPPAARRVPTTSRVVAS